MDTLSAEFVGIFGFAYEDSLTYLYHMEMISTDQSRCKYMQKYSKHVEPISSRRTEHTPIVTKCV